MACWLGEKSEQEKGHQRTSWGWLRLCWRGRRPVRGPLPGANMAILGMNLGVQVQVQMVTSEWVGSTRVGVWNGLPGSGGVMVTEGVGSSGRCCLSAVSTLPSVLTMFRMSESLNCIMLWRWPNVFNSSSKYPVKPEIHAWPGPSQHCIDFIQKKKKKTQYKYLKQLIEYV